MVRVIDMHNHLVAPEVVTFLERDGAHYNTRIIEENGQRFFIIQDTARRPLHARISQVEARLSDMDAEGVDIQAISCVPFVMYPEVSAAWGIAIARLNNEALAAACARYPERFVPLASVPLQDPPPPRLSYNALPAWDCVVWRFRRICRGKAWMNPSSRSFGKRPRPSTWWSAFTRLKQRPRACWPVMA